MTGRKKDPLRTLTEEEKTWLERISRAHSEPAMHVARAKEILAVASGWSYTDAAQLAGKKSGDAVSQLVERFNQEGLQAIQPKHGGGPIVKYSAMERERVLAEARRQPDPEKDGTIIAAEKLMNAMRKADGAYRTYAEMAGHYGTENVTVRNLLVARLDLENNLILVRGAVPGHRDSVVLVRDSERSGALVS